MSEPSDRAIRFERRGTAAWITLNRPDALNSISPQLIDQFNVALNDVEREPAIRSIVVTGAGRAFCTGGDLKAVSAIAASDELADASSAFLASISKLMSRLERMPLPVIGAINGMALAGGLELALCCDLIIAVEDARFGDVHARYGLLPGGGGSVRLPRRVGANRAKYLMFTAEQISARRMMEWGLVNEVVPPSELEACVARLAEALAEKSAVGLRRMKQMVDDGLEQPTEVALRTEQIVCEAHNESYDRNEGLAAFIERRAPRFKGC